MRVQKIGSHYRAIRRKKIGEGDVWKANEGVGVGEEEVEVEERWKEWADVCGEVLGMEILGLDILEEGEGGGLGKEHVLEVNSSSIGFSVNNRQEDFGHIVELLLVHLEKRSGEVRRKRIGREAWQEAERRLKEGSLRVGVGREEGYGMVRELGRRLRQKRLAQLNNGKKDFIAFDEADLKVLRPKMIFSKELELIDAPPQMQLIDLTLSLWILSFSSNYEPQTAEESHLLSPLLAFIRDLFHFAHPVKYMTDIDNALEMMEGLLGVLVREEKGKEEKGKEREEGEVVVENGKGKEREEKKKGKKGKK